MGAERQDCFSNQVYQSILIQGPGGERECVTDLAPAPTHLIPSFLQLFHRFVQILSCSDTIHDDADIVGVTKVGAEGRIDGSLVGYFT